MASLYVHIPFCEHKCIYCDFYSLAPSGTSDAHRLLVENFLHALETEIKLRAGDSCFSERIETIFFGGGTPSLLRPSEIEKILDLIKSRFSIHANAEVTLETNPGTVDKEKLHALYSAGINRLSIGIQSFHENDLKFLTRIHTAAEAKQCIEHAYAAGFDNVSFDLIFSLPGQTRQQWISNLKQAIELEPMHLSCYNLIIEPETPLFHMIRSDQVSPTEADMEAELYECTIDFLTSHGYEQYEVSNFARSSTAGVSNFKCRHNLNYWNHSNYLGLGPSAHSFWTDERWWNISDIATYNKQLDEGLFPLSGGEHLTESQLMEEAVFLGLRSEGINLKYFRQRFGCDFISEYKQTVDEIIMQKHALIDNGRLRLTAKGYVLCDEICQLFR